VLENGDVGAGVWCWTHVVTELSKYMYMTVI